MYIINNYYVISNFWEHLEKLAIAINEDIIKAVRPLQSEQKETLQNLLRWLHVTPLSVGHWMEKSNVVIDSLALDQPQNLNGILLYLLEGLLPLLTAYCTEMSLHITVSHDFNILPPQKVKLLIDIGDALAVSLCTVSYLRNPFAEFLWS